METPAKQRGGILIYFIIIIFIFTIVMLPIVSVVAFKMQALRFSADREQALQIAEAGINYYQWHLAHFPATYTDGSLPSPYVHNYTDFDTQQAIGQFSLLVTQPPNGSTIVTIQSTGRTNKNPGVTRTITAKYGVPSLAKFAFLSNAVAWIGSGEAVSGPMQSNNGIRFDGSANAPIQSAVQTYTCYSGQGCSSGGQTKNGIWGSASQATQSFWQFPVPAIGFSSVTSDLANLKNLANTSSGKYLAPSGTNGYSLVFNSSGTYTVYKVTNLQSTPTGWDTSHVAHNENIDYKPGVGSGSSNGRTYLNGNSGNSTFAIPANGIIYVEDKVWVEGTVHGRVTLAAGVLPYNSSSAPSIYIPNNIAYSAKDGTDSLGLIAQQDVVVTYKAPSNLEIDAALIAQNGATQFFYFPDDASSLKNTITIYGAIMTYAQWTWSWVDGSGTITSGYQNTVDTYDSNLLYGPPPSFPLSSSDYQQLSWISD